MFHLSNLMSNPTETTTTSTCLKRQASSASNMDNLSKMNKITLISRLLNLPPVLFHEIISSYLYYFEIVRFDIAICNHADRARYLALLNGMVVSSHKCIRTSNQLSWIYKRQIRYESIEFGDEIDEEELCTLYPMHWPSVKKWDIEWGPAASASSVIECLKRCSSLEVLRFDSQEDIFDEEFAETILTLFDVPDFCTHLRKITLGSFLFYTDEMMKAISKHCHNLVHLDFRDLDVTIYPEVMMDFLSICGAKLEELDFLCLFGVSDSEYMQVIKYCPRLKTINFASPSSAVMKEIGRSYPELESLTLKFWNEDNDLDEEGLVALFKGCRKIQKLQLTISVVTSTTMSEHAFIKIFECCHELRSVSLTRVSVTLSSLASLALHCPQLTVLSLSTLAMSKLDLIEFSVKSHFPSLRQLVCDNINIGDRFLLEFARKSPLLHMLRLYSCVYVSDVGMYHIATHCRNLSYIYFSNMVGVYSPDYLIEIIVNNPKIHTDPYRSGFHFTGSKLINASLIFAAHANPTGSRYSAELQAIFDSRAL